MLAPILAAVLTLPSPAADHVIVRGTAARDDTLVIELPTKATRIDYDGGAGGFDALEIRGGSARMQRITQLNPHDGIIEIDGLTIHYSNLEPITDTSAAAFLLINGTPGMDTVSITDGPGGTTTVSSPTFESVTFANKTTVRFNGMGGGDTVDFNNPTPATGLQTLLVENVSTVTQTGAINYPALGVVAFGDVTLPLATNDVDNVEFFAFGGGITFADTDGFILGGADPTILGTIASNDILLSAFGTEGISVTEQLVSSAGNITLRTSRLDIVSGVLSPSNSVFIETQNFAPNVDLGSATDANATALELSDAEIDRIDAALLSITTFIGTITVTQPITYDTHLLLRTPNWVTVSGAGSLSVPTLTFELQGGTTRTVTITPTTVQMSGGAAIPYSGVTTLNFNTSIPGFNPGTSTDTFNVTPSATTTYNIDANLPAPPASPGDTLDLDLTGVTSPVLTATFGPNGYSGSLTSANRQPVNFADIETIIGAPVDVGVTKTDNATTMFAGSPVTYTIVVTNSAPIPVAGVTVTDTFSPQLTGVTWTCTASAGSTCAGAGSGNLNQLVTVGANGSVTYTVNGTLNPSTAPGTLTNTVNVTTPPGYVETNATNDSATDNTAITTSADLRVTKTPSAAQSGAGLDLPYTITLRNAGPSDAQNVTLTDTLPANVTFVSLAAPAGYNCTTPAVGATGTVTCTRATLPPSATADIFTLTVNVNRVTAPGTSITNTVTATSTTTDPAPGNNTAPAAVTVFDTSIPTLSTWMLLLLALSLAIVAVRR